MSKLMRLKSTRDRLLIRMKRLIELELPSHIIVGPPPEESVRMNDDVTRSCIVAMLRWAEDATKSDVLPRLASLRKGISTHLDLFCSMFNGLGSEPLTHYCWSAGGGRCCSSDSEAVSKMKVAAENVVYGLLCTGNDPTFVKWFSIAARVR
eukprot:15442012-Alexandrium_andersonii.AAC.1